ncbi:hypothetical protein EST38_g9410 [Candolleomyces aberdarensis]|uniref:Uncharacterized protein n=1 Tax=Candolleomyces aberdarensis TaxID=2316362 RepID=A0A4Q2DBQ6_9AGAR|nr:hypothetical protein EST38_g9410 [Candolleomyces aberdarensis]
MPSPSTVESWSQPGFSIATTGKPARMKPSGKNPRNPVKKKVANVKAERLAVRDNHEASATRIGDSASSKVALSPREEKNTCVQDEIIEIYSDSSDPPVGNLPLQPGDSVYRGPRVTNSRVHSVQAQRNVSPPITRQRARIIGPSALLSPAEISATHTRIVKRKDPSDLSTRPSKKSKRWLSLFSKPKRLSPSSIKPFKRILASPPALSSSDPEELPEPGVFLANLKRSRAPKSTFVDDEAHHASVNESGEASSKDGYDTSDSFIDDTAEGAVGRTNRSESAGAGSDADSDHDSSDARFQDDEEWGGINISGDEQEPERSDGGALSDGVASIAEEGSHAKEVVDERAIAHEKQGNSKLSKREIIKSALRQRDAKRHVRQAVDNSSKFGLPTPSTPVRFRGIPGDTLTTPTKPRVEKGKGRARTPTEDEASDYSDTTDENLLSDYERNMRRALRISRDENSARTPVRSSFTSGASSSKASVSKQEFIKPPFASPSTPLPAGPTQPLPKVPASSQSSNHQPTSILFNDASIKHHCTELPAVDDVNKKELQDNLLADDYAMCPHLRAGEIIPLNASLPQGHPSFSAWETVLTSDVRTAWSAVRFVDMPGAQYINPCRASPVRVDCKEVIPGKKFNLMRNGRPLTAVVSGWLESSQLTHLGTGPVKSKNIRVNFHCQEHERYSAWSCMVFGQPLVHAHMWLDALQISTRSVPKDSSVKPHVVGLFKKPAGGSSEGNSNDNGLGVDDHSLPYSADVPVYDARDTVPIDFNVDLPNLPALLPRFYGEIPRGSLVVVAHTMTLYLSSSGPHAGKWTLGCNILWVLLLGTPNAEAVMRGQGQ